MLKFISEPVSTHSAKPDPTYPSPTHTNGVGQEWIYINSYGAGRGGDVMNVSRGGYGIDETRTRPNPLPSLIECEACLAVDEEKCPRSEDKRARLHIDSPFNPSLFSTRIMNTTTTL